MLNLSRQPDIPAICVCIGCVVVFLVHKTSNHLRARTQAVLVAQIREDIKRLPEIRINEFSSTVLVDQDIGSISLNVLNLKTDIYFVYRSDAKVEIGPKKMVESTSP